VAIFLSRTIATPPAVAPNKETPLVISHATLLKHTGHISNSPFHPFDLVFLAGDTSLGLLALLTSFLSANTHLLAGKIRPKFPQNDLNRLAR
jgi:hypothetical protein